MKSNLVSIVLIAAAMVVPTAIAAQNAAAPAATASMYSGDSSYKGINAYENFRGIVTDRGALLKLDSSVGYDFSRNFGIFAGVPFYFTNSFDNATSSTTLRASGMGDAYVGVELYTFSKVLRYSSSVTVGFPTGNVAKGFSPGEMTADWTNHFRRTFGRFTPEFSVGIGNTIGVGIGAVPSSELINSSLSSTGMFVHMEEGAEFDITRHLYVGGAAYQVRPTSEQTAANLATTASNSVARENGIDSWIGFQPNRILRTEIGYSRSTTFALNSVSFKVAVNVARLVHHKNAQH